MQKSAKVKAKTETEKLSKSGWSKSEFQLSVKFAENWIGAVIRESLNINLFDWKNYVIVTEKKKFLFENEFKTSEYQRSSRMSY